MSELVERLIGAFVEPTPSAHPLAELVEHELRKDSNIKAFLESLPECPPSERLRVISLNEHEAVCSCPFSAKDHESTSYLHSEVLVAVDLAKRRCKIFAPGLV